MTPMGSNVELHRTVRERLSEREQRYTTGRRRIVEVLVAAEGPVTLPELLTKQPVLSQSSAYRNLSIMEEAGIVRRLVHGAEHAHYELAEDLTGEGEFVFGDVDADAFGKVERPVDRFGSNVGGCHPRCPQ